MSGMNLSGTQAQKAPAELAICGVFRWRDVGEASESGEQWHTEDGAPVGDEAGWVCSGCSLWDDEEHGAHDVHAIAEVYDGTRGLSQMTSEELGALPMGLLVLLMEQCIDPWTWAEVHRQRGVTVVGCSGEYPECSHAHDHGPTTGEGLGDGTGVAAPVESPPPSAAQPPPHLAGYDADHCPGCVHDAASMDAAWRGRSAMLRADEGCGMEYGPCGPNGERIGGPTHLATCTLPPGHDGWHGQRCGSVTPLPVAGGTLPVRCHLAAGHQVLHRAVDPAPRVAVLGWSSDYEYEVAP